MITFKAITVIFLLSLLLGCKGDNEVENNNSNTRVNPNKIKISKEASINYLTEFFGDENIIALGSQEMESIIIDEEINQWLAEEKVETIKGVFWFYTEMKSRIIYKGENKAIGIPYQNDGVIAKAESQIRYLDYSPNNYKEPFTKLKYDYDLIVRGGVEAKTPFGHKSFTKNGVTWKIIDAKVDSYDTEDYEVIYVNPIPVINNESDTYSFDMLTFRVKNMKYHFNKSNPNQIEVYRFNPNTAIYGEGVTLKKGQLKAVDALIQLIVEQVGELNLLPAK